MRAREAEGVVDRAVRDELHVLGSADVLAKVDLVEAVLRRVVVEVAELGAAREVIVLLGGGDLPREKARGEGEHLVALGAAVHRDGEGEHRLVVARRVVGKGEALGDGVADGLWSVRAARRRLLAEEAGVAARHVAGAHDVAEHHDVLRLGDDGLGVAGVVPGNSHALAVSEGLHGSMASVQSCKGKGRGLLKCLIVARKYALDVIKSSQFRILHCQQWENLE